MRSVSSGRGLLSSVRLSTLLDVSVILSFVEPLTEGFLWSERFPLHFDNKLPIMACVEVKGEVTACRPKNSNSRRELWSC